MNRQQPLALAPPAGDADWSEQSLLDGAMRRALGSINLAFLDLAIELAEEGRLKQIAGLPPRAIDSLIDPDAGSRLCERLPYALFDLRFSDGNFWTAEVAAAGGVQDASAQPAADERMVGFARAAIMVAWHLAQTRTAAARGSFLARPRRPSPRSPRCRSPPSSGSRGASRPRCRRDSARARGSGCSSRAARPARRPVREPAAAARTADPGRGERAGAGAAAASPAERRLR